jgi:hypothetical protein
MDGYYRRSFTIRRPVLHHPSKGWKGRVDGVRGRLPDSTALLKKLFLMSEIVSNMRQTGMY